jgi:hypothetical protein
MRCPDCKKFVSMESTFEDEEASFEDGEVTVQVTLKRNCAECSIEMKEHAFEKVESVPDWDPEAHRGDDHEQSAEVENVEESERSEGTGRGRKTFYGFTADVTVTCKCGWEVKLRVEDDIQASYMTDLV